MVKIFGPKSGSAGWKLGAVLLATAIAVPAAGQQAGPVQTVASAAAYTAPATPRLPGMTEHEMQADTVWVMRSGLNVAALQCQFSPFLRAVPTYNALLRQHSDELAQAFKTMTGYFVRTLGARTGQRAFDTYATRTNQNWTTFDAQLTFCDRASNVGKRALALPKGQFASFAATEMAALRESTTGNTRLIHLEPRLHLLSVPNNNDICLYRSKRQCR